ncbi:MAG: pyruvate dehydrogenase (acetyl-transferring), homodimeric type, partial [Anaerolineae bacterium]|nr:pyruvate dehydrogenase (acetyl-transferring), homodimeric type [Anaerolineae bacterium]
MQRIEEGNGYTPEIQEVETEEWLASLNYVLHEGGPERVLELFEELKKHAARLGIKEPFTANTPYVNTIPPEDEPRYPGNRALERRIKSLVRWNAMSMV